MFDVIIMGGGVVGAAVLDAATNKGFKCLLIEKEDDVATGASRANSGIVHAGYDCVPDTLKARFNVRGNEMMPSLAEELDVPYKKTGSLVLSREYPSKALDELLYRGKKNGVDVKIIDRKDIDKIQKGIHPSIKAALYAKEAGIISPYKLTIALCDRAVLNGATVALNEEIQEMAFNNDIFTVKTQNSQYRTKFLINAAGGNAGKINALIGEENYETQYKKGEYFVLDSTEGASLNTVLFPLPDERGKGILAAPTADGNLIYGPTSVECEAEDTAVTPVGLSTVKQAVTEILESPRFGKVVREYAGVRAAVGEDFIVKQSEKIKGYYILAGICSPGLTSAPAIGEYIANELLREYQPASPSRLLTEVRHARLNDFSAEELNKKIAADERWGRIICRCERVTEAEIVNAIHSPVPATTVDAVKRRVRAGMGRCQGGFCMPRVMEILSRELDIPLTAVKKGGEGSNLVKCRIKEGDNA